MPRTYRDGFNAGVETGYVQGYADGRKDGREFVQEQRDREIRAFERDFPNERSAMRKPKRKLSAWNKFVKANSKKKIFRFANGKLKLKKMGIAFRKTRAGRKR